MRQSNRLCVMLESSRDIAKEAAFLQAVYCFCLGQHKSVNALLFATKLLRDFTVNEVYLTHCKCILLQFHGQ